MNVEVVSEEDGILQEQLASEGDTVEVGQAIAIVGEGKGKVVQANHKITIQILKMKTQNRFCRN